MKDVYTKEEFDAAYNDAVYFRKRCETLENPMQCGHYGANLQPDDSGADVCMVCAEVAELKAEHALAQQLERATIEREQLAQTYDKTVERLEREIVQYRGEYVRGLERALAVLHTQMARGWDGSMILMYKAIQAEIDNAKAGND